jgi:hypothetical protein
MAAMLVGDMLVGGMVAGSRGAPTPEGGMPAGGGSVTAGKKGADGPSEVTGYGRGPAGHWLGSTPTGSCGTVDM